MSNNAQWWVRGYDKKSGQPLFVSLMSPDLRDVREAHKRARNEAKRRWRKAGAVPSLVTSQCVG